MYLLRSEFCVEDSFQKKKLMDFVGSLGFTGGVAPSDEADKNI